MSKRIRDKIKKIDNKDRFIMLPTDIKKVSKKKTEAKA